MALCWLQAINTPSVIRPVYKLHCYTCWSEMTESWPGCLRSQLPGHTGHDHSWHETAYAAICNMIYNCFRPNLIAASTLTLVNIYRVSVIFRTKLQLVALTLMELINEDKNFLNVNGCLFVFGTSGMEAIISKYQVLSLQIWLMIRYLALSLKLQMFSNFTAAILPGFISVTSYFMVWYCG